MDTTRNQSNQPARPPTIRHNVVNCANCNGEHPRLEFVAVRERKYVRVDGRRALAIWVGRCPANRKKIYLVQTAKPAPVPAPVEPPPQSS